MPDGVTIEGVPFSVSPMKATGMPWKLLTPYGGNRVSPLAVSSTLAARKSKAAPSKG
jgi:hypothetical protein